MLLYKPLGKDDITKLLEKGVLKMKAEERFSSSLHKVPKTPGTWIIAVSPRTLGQRYYLSKVSTKQSNDVLVRVHVEGDKIELSRDDIVDIVRGYTGDQPIRFEQSHVWGTFRF